MSKNTPERHDIYCDKQYPMIKKIVCNVLEYKNRRLISCSMVLAQLNIPKQE